MDDTNGTYALKLFAARRTIQDRSVLYSSMLVALGFCDAARVCGLSFPWNLACGVVVGVLFLVAFSETGPLELPVRPPRDAEGKYWFLLKTYNLLMLGGFLATAGMGIGFYLADSPWMHSAPSIAMLVAYMVAWLVAEYVIRS